MKLSKVIACFLLSIAAFGTFAAENHAHGQEEEKMDISKQIFGHIKDAHDWHIFSLGDFHATIPLPVILYSPEKGFSVFSSSRFDHGHAAYEGYMLNEEGKVEALDGSKVYDFSITKNVMAMLIGVVITFIIMISVARRYQKKGSHSAPNGLQNMIEMAVVFIRDEVVKPNIGPSYMKFMPVVLSIFFFIWITNLLGLIPGGANFTGNIAVTAGLAFVSLIVMLITSKKAFWAHLFNPPGVPFPVKIILVPIELISFIVKPVALTIRLFANILAGHIVILSFILLIFIFAELNVFVGAAFSPVSVLLAVFMFLIEFLVAAIQAFIFANLVAVFIGQMVEEGHHEAEEGYDFENAKDELSLL